MFLAGLFIVCFSLPIMISMVRILYLTTFTDTHTLAYGNDKEVIIIAALFFTVLMIIGIILIIVGLLMKKKIARTTIQVNYTNQEDTLRSVSNLLQKRGYKNITKNNENIWKCGVGFWTAIKYIKIDIAGNNTMLVSGWIRPLGGGEQNLEGVLCIIPKKQVQGVMHEIQCLAK